MMNIKNNAPSRKKIIISIILLIVAGTVSVAVLEKTGVIDLIRPASTPSTGSTEVEKKEQQKSEDDTKQDFVETPDPETAPQTSPSSIELSARNESSSSVTVLTKLYNVANGSCTLTVSNGSATDTQTAPVIYQPNFSSCAGFSVQKDKLGPGEWTIKLSLHTDTTLEKIITYRVD